jgi:hypothetical protein
MIKSLIGFIFKVFSGGFKKLDEWIGKIIKAFLVLIILLLDHTYQEEHTKVVVWFKGLFKKKDKLATPTATITAIQSDVEEPIIASQASFEPIVASNAAFNVKTPVSQ